VETDVVHWRTLDVHGKRTFVEYELLLGDLLRRDQRS
jgi:hypothetical protein